MSGAPSRVVIVGAGGIATSYASPFARLPSVRAVGVADVDLVAAQRWASSVAATDPSVPIVVTEQVTDLVRLAPDVAVVCTPPSSHREIAESFLHEGIAVLCEKPLAVDATSAHALAECARATGVPLGMAAKFRFCPDVRTAAELLANGAIGAPRLIEVVFTSRVDMSARWNARREISGGGVIVDNGTHAIDLLHSLGFEPASLLAVEQARPVGLAVEDTARLHLVATSGLDATIDLSWSMDRGAPEFLRIYGTAGELRVGWQTSTHRRYDGEAVTIGAGYDKLVAMGGALEQFCEAARYGLAPAVDAASAVAAAHVVDAAYRSLGAGARVAVQARPR